MKKRSMQKLEKERLEVHDSNSILMKKYSDANLNEQLLLKELNEITNDVIEKLTKNRHNYLVILKANHIVLLRNNKEHK